MPRHFFIIGAQRSGTTYLRALLDAHPDIAMAQPVRPEPKHFLRPGSEATPQDDYRRQWFPATDATVYGEKSTSYLDDPTAASRIAAVFPDATIVVCVREPVERAISHYRFSRQHGVETLPIEEALTDRAEERSWDRARFSVSPFLYLSRGEYVRQLEPWAELFGRIEVVVFERLVVDPAELARLYGALSVDARFSPERPGDPVNASEGGDGSLPPLVVARLARRFDAANQRLEEWVGPIPEWRRL